MTRRALLAVRPASAAAGLAPLLSALAQAFPVDCAPYAEGRRCDGVLAIGAEGLDGLADGGAPVLALAAGAPSAERASVILADHPRVDRRLRGIDLDPQALGAPLAVADGEDVLATATAGGAAWTASRDGTLQRVAVPAPELGPGDVLRDALHSPRSLALIALVQHLRALAGDDGSAAPPLRAAMLFDDPNLRHPTYGFVRYPELLRHADEHGYHASMAMIPLDARGPSAKAVALFRDRPDRLSLAYHGNNHEKRELLQPADLDGALALGAQALRRVGRFEAKTGLAVDRVMIPPHGMCSPPTARGLGALAFDGLCAIHPFPWTERPPADRPLAGWDPATFVEGCAVIPRIPLTWGATGVALHAFLDHPIVLYGHHDDVAGGLEPLARGAAAVNRLGDVRWCSLGAIAQSNHRLTVEGGRATVQAYANRCRVALPEGTTELTVAAPVGGADGFAGWSLDGEQAAFGAVLPCDGATTTSEVRLVSRWATDPGAVRVPATRPWPVLRRAATELRDRVAPLRR